MFTGIITDIGELTERAGGRLTIRCSYAAQGIAIGASIACDGACLTATTVTAAGSGSVSLTADALNQVAEGEETNNVITYGFSIHN